MYAGQSLAIQTLAAKVLQLDLALSDYGPEANGVRAQFRQGLGKTIDEVWGSNESDANFVATNFAAAIHNMRNRDATIDALHPSTDAQTQALAAAKATVESIGQSRLQMSFALASPISIPLIVIVAAWAAFLFFGYGLMSGGNATSFVAVALGPFDHPRPRRLLAVIDLAQIKHRALDHPAASTALAFDNAPVTVLLAVLLPSGEL